MTDLLFGAPPAAAERRTPLAERFVVPPFSVLDTRQGYWQERKRAWLALGIQSEIGRGDDLQATGANSVYNGGSAIRRPALAESYASQGAMNAMMGNGDAISTGTSIFDPVLCELAYRWFCPEGGTVLDPFAGGSVRGIVASRLGHPYTGIDLSPAQVAANSEQGQRIAEAPYPQWLVGDSRELLPVMSGQYDLVFSCPPYYDLEVYSDDPADLSALPSYGRFRDAFGDIIAAAARRLRDNRYMVLVVSEIRDKDGFCRGLVPDTIGLAAAAGLRLYNEAVLIGVAGTLPLRVGKYMEATRKLGRAHQAVLVFAKGDPARGWSYERPAPPDPQIGMFG